MRKLLLILALIVLVGATAIPRLAADVIFYNGDFKDMDNLSCERNTNVADSRAYEDFHVSRTSQITGLWGHFLQNTSTPLSQAYYEVRQGISSGSGGTLISSGTIDVTKTVVAQSGWGVPVYRIDGTLSGLVLATGDYWMTLAPIGQGMGSGDWWVLASTGANAVGSQAFDSVSCWDSPSYNKRWVMLPNRDLTSEGNWSFGVSGTSVPEPSSILALLCGIGGLGGMLRRRQPAKRS